MRAQVHCFYGGGGRECSIQETVSTNGHSNTPVSYALPEAHSLPTKSLFHLHLKLDAFLAALLDRIWQKSMTY